MDGLFFVEAFLSILVILFVVALSLYLVYFLKEKIIENYFHKGKNIIFENKKTKEQVVISNGIYFIITNKYKKKLFTDGSSFYPLDECHLS